MDLENLLSSCEAQHPAMCKGFKEKIWRVPICILQVFSRHLKSTQPQISTLDLKSSHFAGGVLSSTDSPMIWRVFAGLWESKAACRSTMATPSYFFWFTIDLKYWIQTWVQSVSLSPFQGGIWRVPSLVPGWSPINAMWSEECPSFDWESMATWEWIYLKNFQRPPYFPWCWMNLKSGRCSKEDLKSGQAPKADLKSG